MENWRARAKVVMISDKRPGGEFSCWFQYDDAKYQFECRSARFIDETKDLVEVDVNQKKVLVLKLWIFR